MSRAAALGRALWGLIVAASLAGCSSLPFFGDKDKDEAPAEPLVAQYELQVDAPKPLDKLLLDYLDLGRFQKTPRADAITTTELDRLAAAAPTQARSLLETEGYFNATVKVARNDPAQGLPHLTVTVEPGPRVAVRSVNLDAAPPLEPRTPTRDEPWSDRLDHLRRTWPLPAGKPFREADWSGAKTTTLGALRADGYPKASWQSTHARVDATDNVADLDLVAEGGPLYHLGEIRVEGVSLFDEVSVRRLATFSYGQVYSERLLLDYQDRLIKIGLFEGASVELDSNGPAEGAPVRVKVKELTQYQANFGIGYSANTGPRASVDLYDRHVFGTPWIAHASIIYGPDHKLVGAEFNSYPLENQWRNLFAGNVEQLLTAGETRDSVTARVGRAQETTRYERLYYAELVQARVDSAPLTSSSHAVTVNYNWLHRDVDNVLQPTEGLALSLQGGIGYGDGSEQRSDLVDEQTSKGPFIRAYTRVGWYRPFGAWFANARVEAGQVFVRNRIGVPDTILYRAGGDNSVRGYDYRTLGPIVNGAVVGGRVLATGSIEFEHSLTERLPALLGAVFFDAGNAADDWRGFHPVYGYGVGTHYRSPVGALRLDVAYGQSDRRIRLLLSVGVNFNGNR
jgi:translocation and assembly module TamA